MGDAHRHLRPADRLGGGLHLSDLLDPDDVLQNGARRDEGQSRSLVGLHAEMARLEVPRPVAGHHRQHLDRARRVPEAVPQQRDHLGLRLGARGHPGLARRLWPQPLLLSLRLHAQFGYLLLLSLAAHPAAGRARSAIFGALQGAGPTRQPHRHDRDLHADGAPDRHLDHARPVRLGAGRARRGRFGRRSLDLGRVFEDRSAARAPRHRRRLHPLAGAVLERIFLRRPCSPVRTPRRCR